ncbi:MAG: zinc-dependent metalloprotease [Acidimicrobiales bacterium]
MNSEVDWEFARSVAGRIAGREPFSDSYHRQSLESDLLELTVQAEELVQIETGLVSGSGLAKAKVTDRMGWIDANLASFDRLLRPLLGRIDVEADSSSDSELDADPSSDPNSDDQSGGFADTSLGKALAPVGELIAPVGSAVGDAFGQVGSVVGPKFAGAEVGALLGWMSGRVLGQYDLLIIEDERPEDQDWVYYVGPNVLSLEKRYGFPPREFRLWIAVHECTHRAQFTGVPWLRPYFLSLVNELLDTVEPDPKRLVDAVRDSMVERRAGNGMSLKDGGLSALFATPEQRATMDKVTGLMSLLEGHGDITMDRAAKHLIPSQPRFARVMSQRRQNASGVSKVIQRLTGMEAKMAQYQEGEDFVHAVEAAGGSELFNQVWTEPETLPTIAEIRDPALWIERIGAPANA